MSGVKFHARNLAPVTDRMVMPSSAMCLSGMFWVVEHLNKSFDVLPAFSPILHRLEYTAKLYISRGERPILGHDISKEKGVNAVSFDVATFC